MKTILFATDLSARSDRALGRAAVLAHEHNAHLVVLHIVDEEQRPSVAQHLLESARTAIAQDVAALPKDARPLDEVEIRVELGRDFLDIVRHAEDAHADLIVLGKHRSADALDDMFRGTTAERVIRETHAPVLQVKDPCRHPYARVLVAVDFSVYSRRAVQTALRLCPRARFHLLHVYHVPFSGFLVGRDTRDDVRRKHATRLTAMIEEELTALAGLAAGHVPAVEKTVREGEIRSAIREEVTRITPDLLVVGSHGRTGVGHALLGSVAEDLLHSPPCDVMAVKAW